MTKDVIHVLKYIISIAMVVTEQDPCPPCPKCSAAWRLGLNNQADPLLSARV